MIFLFHYRYYCVVMVANCWFRRDVCWAYLPFSYAAVVYGARAVHSLLSRFVGDVYRAVMTGAQRSNIASQRCLPFYPLYLPSLRPPRATCLYHYPHPIYNTTCLSCLRKTPAFLPPCRLDDVCRANPVTFRPDDCGLTHARTRLGAVAWRNIQRLALYHHHPPDLQRRAHVWAAFSHAICWRRARTRAPRQHLAWRDNGGGVRRFCMRVLWYCVRFALVWALLELVVGSWMVCVQDKERTL